LLQAALGVNVGPTINTQDKNRARRRRSILQGVRDGEEDHLFNTTTAETWKCRAASITTKSGYGGG
jgi:hypothetical protein